jgi:cell division protein FtsN
MPRDYRHGAQHQRTQFQRRSQKPEQDSPTEKNSSAKVWFVGLLVSVSFVAGYFVIDHFVDQAKENDKPTDKSIFLAAKELKNQAQDSVAQIKNKLEPKQEPVVVDAVQVDKEEQLVKIEEPTQYSFYEGLAKSEVVVEAVPISIQLKQPYYIQAGTFGSEKIARKEQQRLLKMGQKIEVSIYQGTKRIYYRLRVGPFTDRLELNKKRNELRRLGVDTLLVKAPKLN